jgi:hypothetical protein
MDPPLLLLDEQDQDMAPVDAAVPEPPRQREPVRATVVQPLSLPQHGSVRLPDFWVSDPNMWFAQAEAAFRRAGVASSIVRYDYMLMKLPEDVLRSVRDLVQAVTDDTPDAYEQLKYRLLSSYGMSKWQLAGRIIDYAVAPDARPSSLLDGMLSLLPTGEQPGVIFMALFLKKLPQDVRDHLCSRNFDSVRDMAIFADQMWDAKGQLGVSYGGCHRLQVAERGCRRSKSPGRGKMRQTPGGGVGDLCYYHATYAERAHKCRPPCSWTGNAPAAGTN